MPPRHVLHLISNLDVGGAQEVVASLTPRLAEFGWQPTVVTLRDGPVRGRLEGRGVEVVEVSGRSRPLSSGPGAWRDVQEVRASIRRLMHERDVDIVQTHLARSMDFVMLSLRRRRHGRPSRGVVWTVHNARVELRADQVPDSRFLGLRRRAYRTAYQTGSRLGADIVAVSDEVARSVMREYRPPRDRLHTISNGVDMERFGGPFDREAIRDAEGIDRSDTVLIVVAKMYPQKGHHDLVEALRLVAPDMPGLRVLLLGDGPLRPELERAVDAAGLSDVVDFLGIREDIPSLLAMSDLFVLPSHWEGLPMALLEGMASGLPVVATAVSGTAQVVEHGVSGLLVPPRDPVGLATAISSLVGDKDRAAALGTAARRRVSEQYSATAQARQHAELYDAIVQRHGGTV